MHRLLLLIVLIAAGCHSEAPEKPPTQVAAVNGDEHVSRDICVAFVDGVINNLYADSIVNFPADSDLSPAEQVNAFRQLETYIMADKWTAEFTAITVIDGKEDSAELYFRGAKIGWLLLLCDYHYGTSEWKLSAYEIPQRSFARPEDVSFSEYIEQSLAESQVAAKPYVPGTKPDGVYFLE